MNKLIKPKLINGSFGDPLIYCQVAYQGRAFAFDMGASFDLANRELQRIDTVYISHTHMDHIFGFDHFLRVNVKQDRHIRIFGPPGIHKNIQGKLKGFTWNLVHGYGLVFEVFEVREETLVHYVMYSHKRFRLEKVDERPLRQKWVHPIDKTPFYTVRTAALDHRTISQAYSVTENITVSINKEALDKNGWLSGSWLQDLKTLAIKGRGDDKKLNVPKKDGNTRAMRVSHLKKQLIIPRKRNRITYVTDAVFSDENAKRIVKLAKDSDIFFCESTFLHKDEDKALETRHLTAKQSGTLAKLAGCKRLVLFHFSKKYLTDPKQLIEEASQAFGKKAEAYAAYSGQYHYRPNHMSNRLTKPEATLE